MHGVHGVHDVHDVHRDGRIGVFYVIRKGYPKGIAFCGSPECTDFCWKIEKDGLRLLVFLGLAKGV